MRARPSERFLEGRASVTQLPDQVGVVLGDPALGQPFLDAPVPIHPSDVGVELMVPGRIYHLMVRLKRAYFNI